MRGAAQTKLRGSRGPSQSQRSAQEITAAIREPSAEPLAPRPQPPAASPAATPRASDPAMAALPTPAVPISSAQTLRSPLPKAPASLSLPPVEASRRPLRPREPARELASEATQYHAVPSFERAVRGVLVVVDGEPSGQAFALSEGDNVIGRDAGCEVVLSPDSISRRHARITCEDGFYIIESLSEANKTWLNGDQEVGEPSELNDDDSIRLARTTLRFRTIQGL